MRYRTNERCDDKNSPVCGIRDCSEKATEGLWITIKAQPAYKRFCSKHFSEEYSAEVCYEVGL
jgi:hypothetical protein